VFGHTHQSLFFNNKNKIDNIMILYFEEMHFYVCMIKHYLFIFVTIEECLIVFRYTH